MVQINFCKCNELETKRINSYEEFETIRAYFNTKVLNGIYEETSEFHELKLYADLGNVTVRWNADKSYRCKYCGQHWALEYPNFPAVGSIYKINDSGNIC